MHTTNLRKVGGSVMVAVPPAFLDQLNLQAGAKVGVSVENGRLVVDARPLPRFTLDELLSQCDASVNLAQEEHDWLEASPVGGELL